MSITLALCNIFNYNYCQECQELEHKIKCLKCKEKRKQLKQKVIHFFEEKTPDCFSYEETDLDPESYSYEQIFTENRWTFDKNTFSWICKYGIPQKLIKTLASAGIVKHSNSNVFRGNRAFTGIIRKKSDDVIIWLLYLGFIPEDWCYSYYLNRKDKTFDEKLKMIELFYSKGIDFGLNSISACFYASDDLEEVKSFVTFFLERKCEQTSSDLNSGFRAKGLEFMKWLYEIGFKCYNMNGFVTENRTLSEVKLALEFIEKKQKLPDSNEIYNELLYLKNDIFDHFKFFFEKGVKLEANYFLIQLLFQDRGIKRNIEDVQKVVLFVLENTDFKIEQYNEHLFLNRYSYKIPEIYNWMQNQPKIALAKARQDFRSVLFSLKKM